MKTFGYDEQRAEIKRFLDKDMVFHARTSLNHMIRDLGYDEA